MAAQPIYVETEEEISELIDRLRGMTSDDIPIVLPARSRLGQSRFNFQLLRHYAGQLGKRVSIISADPAVQRMAAETGLSTYSQMRDFGAGGGPGAQVPAPPAWEPVPVPEFAAARARAAIDPVPIERPVRARPQTPPPARVAVPAPARLPSRAGEAGPGRTVLYAGAVLVLLAGLAAFFVFYPSANVTLVADAREFKQQADVTAAPGKPPVRIRTATLDKKSSQGFTTTGQKITPAVAATGAVNWTNKCPVGVVLKNGQRVSGAGQVFAQQGDLSLSPGSSGSAPVIAVSTGERGNVPAGAITSYTGDSDLGTCLAVSNPAPTGGGADEKREPQMTQTDFDALRSTMEQGLQKDASDELARQAAQGERLSDKVFFQPPDFGTDHRVGDLVKSFSGTMTVKAEGTFYNEADVRKAFGDNLAQRVPSGFALTDNSVRSDFSLRNAAPGGNLVFTGTSSAYIAPRLNYSQIKAHVVGKSPAQARTYLRGLPVRSVELKQRPFQLPIMPVLSSRVDVKYVVQSAAPAA